MFGRAAGAAMKGIRTIPQRGFSTATHASSRGVNPVLAGSAATMLGLAGYGTYKLDELQTKLAKERVQREIDRKQFQENENNRFNQNHRKGKYAPPNTTEYEFPPLTNAQRKASEYSRALQEQTYGKNADIYGGMKRKHRGKTHRRKNRKNRKTRRN